RTVEAIDRKQSFAAPSIRQRKLTAPEGPSKTAAAIGKKAATTGNDTTVPDAEVAAAEEKVISPALRSLLSRKVEKLDKQTVMEHGGVCRLSQIKSFRHVFSHWRNVSAKGGRCIDVCLHERESNRARLVYVYYFA
ncbi:MAG: hypothetical protein Q9198_010292, partial [Flavoplaca austrocitrina]